MKIYYVSFTDLLKQVHNDNYRVMDMIPENVEFVFCCRARHVLRDDGKVPFEVSWLNRDLPSCYGSVEDSHGVRCTGIERSKCDILSLATWDSLIGLIKEKNEQGKVTWVAGNYNVFCDRANSEGHQCFWRGEKYVSRLGRMI